MGRRRLRLPSFNAVGAGQTATLNLPTGVRYHNIKMFYKDNATKASIIAAINEVRIKIDGKVQRTFKPDELYKVYAANGVNFIAGLLPIYFSEPWRRNATSEDILAWGTVGVGTFQIEVDIKSTATAPKLHAFAVVDNVQAQLVDIIKWRRQNIPNNETGLLTLNTLSKKPNEVYQRMHCFETAANDINSVDIKLDAFQAFDNDGVTNKANMADQGMVAQDGVFHIIFDETQRIEDGLPVVDRNGTVVSNFELNFDMAEANSFLLLSEVRGNPD